MILVIIISIIVLDQISKYCALNHNSLKSHNKGMIRFTLIKNRGAAFGLLRNRRRLLKIINIFTLTILILYLFIFSPSLQNTSLKLGISFILAGGFSNLIDRIRLNYVIDFITLTFKKCPVFNIADIFIFIGSIIVILSIAF